MADIVSLGDGTTSIDLTTSGGAGTGGEALRIGLIEGTKQTITVERAWITGSTVNNALDRFNTLARLLHDAQSYRAQGLGRRVSLTIQPHNGSNATTYEVVKGRTLDLPPLPGPALAQAHFGPFTLELDVEPFGRASEATLVNATGTLRARNHLTHRFVHHTGATLFSVNLAAQVAGSFWQTTKFSTAPTTVPPFAGDFLYFGSTLNTFSWIVMGISTAAAGITWGVWSYWNGSAWTTVTPSSNTFLNGSNQFGTVSTMGSITFPAMSGHAATTINSVSAFWVRLAVTSVSSPTAPVLKNGPVRSTSGVALVAVTDVDGDVPALGLVHVKNDGATALAGVRAGLATSQLGYPFPPFDVPLLSATTFVPTSGDNTVAVATDAEATVGQRVEATLAPTFSDACQTFDGVSEYATVTLVAADKIDSIAAGSFMIEVGFVLDTDSAAPQCLVSRWDPTSSNRIWGIWADQMKLRGAISTSGTNKYTVNGTTKLKLGIHYMATLEYDASERRVNIYLNSDGEASKSVPSSPVRSGQTTALRFGKSVSYATSDSRNGADAEVFLDGAIDWFMIYTDQVRDFDKDVLDGKGYNFPNDPTGDVPRGDLSKVRALYQMDDSAASTVLSDTAVIYAAQKNMARSSGNTIDNRRPGVLQGGIGSFARLVGGNLPPCLLEEYPGSYRVILMARQAATLTALTDVSLQLQLNVGDSRLQIGPPAYFPALAAPPSNGYYPLDVGIFTLPPGALYDGHRGSGSSANYAQWSVFVLHKFVASTVIYLDNLYLFPTDTWYGEYDVFDDHYESDYAIAQNEGLAWDARGPRPLVYQTTTAGLLVQDRNPYAVPVPTAPRLHPRKAAALFAVGFRGDATGDYLYRVIGDTFTPTVKAVPRFRGLAGS